MRKIRTVVLGACRGSVAGRARNCAKAQDFPTRPVRIVVAFPPGGPTDFVGRVVADKMTTLLGQRVYHRQQAGRQRHARRRRRRQVRSRRLLAVPHHGRRGDGVAAHHGENAIRHRSAISRRSRWSPRSPRCWWCRRSSASKPSRNSSRWPKQKPGAMTVRLDRRRLAAASRADFARRRRRREIPACALSRRGARADRSAWRPGAGGRARHAGGDCADPSRQLCCRSASPADKRDAVSARRSDARRTGLSRTPTRRTGTRCSRRRRRRPQ